MKLITSLDDERLEITSKEWLNTLKHEDPLVRDTSKIVCFFIDSLRAALEELTSFRKYRDEEKIVTFCNDCGPNVSIDEDGLCAGCGATAIGSHIEYISAVVAERDTALAQLCRAREACEELCNKAFVDHERTKFIIPPAFEKSVRLAKAALSSTGPCSHEARIRQLEELLLKISKHPILPIQFVWEIESILRLFPTDRDHSQCEEG